jgi:hypothetical protein
MAAYYWPTSSTSPIWTTNGMTSTTSTWTNTIWITANTASSDYYFDQTETIYNRRLRPAIYLNPPRLVTPQPLLAPAIIRAERRLEIERAREVEAHRAEAKERARGLLIEFLTEDQQRTFLDHGWFIVEGGKSKRKYRVRASQGLVGNVDVMHDNDNNRIMHRLCAHVRLGEVPLGDQLLAQKLMLQFDEDRFLRGCQQTRGLGGHHAQINLRISPADRGSDRRYEPAARGRERLL